MAERMPENVRLGARVLSTRQCLYGLGCGLEMNAMQRSCWNELLQELDAVRGDLCGSLLASDEGDGDGGSSL
jgi:hypothetical protein